MRFFVESYGCTMNYGEGDQLSEKMSSMGHIRVESADEADIVILNTCTVVETTEKKMIRRMSDLRKAGKEVIVTGCMAKVQSNRIDIRLPGSLIIPPEEYTDFENVVSGKYGCEEPLPPAYNSTTGIIPIAQGCLGDCTYCITKFARGRLKSRSPEEIIDRFEKMIDSGVREIMLAAQDTACYGVDIGTDLPTLLKNLLKKDGDYRIRIGMMNPNMLKSILDELLEIMNDRRIYRFLHIPVQSGSNDILARMRRRYTVEDFVEIAERARKKHPDISIATDLIAGFPGETDSDHEKSKLLIGILNADTVNITRFSSRPGTEAMKFEQTHGRIAKERSAELTDIKNKTEYKINSKLIGKMFDALVTEQGKDGSVIARTDNYRPVAISQNVPLGSFITVEITDCASTYLLGRMLNNRIPLP